MRKVAAVLFAILMSVLVCAPALATGPPTAGITGTLFGGTWSLMHSSLGRNLAIVRLYYQLGQKFGPPATDVLASGSTVLVSLDVSAWGPSYAAITAGAYDSEIIAFLAALESTAAADNVAAVYFCFQHEANNPNLAVLGTPADFAAAYTHIHALAAAAGLNWNSGGRIHWVLILMHLAYFTAAERPRWSLRLGFAADYWPAAGIVDVAAADGYNWGQCTRSSPPGFQTPGSVVASPASLFDPLLAFASARNLPVFLAEYASVSYTTTLPQVSFITSIQNYVQSNPQIEAVSYFDLNGPRACDPRVDGRADSLAALAAMGLALTGTVVGP